MFLKEKKSSNSSDQEGGDICLHLGESSNVKKVISYQLIPNFWPLTNLLGTSFPFGWFHLKVTYGHWVRIAFQRGFFLSLTLLTLCSRLPP